MGRDWGLASIIPGTNMAVGIPQQYSGHMIAVADACYGYHIDAPRFFLRFLQFGSLRHVHVLLINPKNRFGEFKTATGF